MIHGRDAFPAKTATLDARNVSSLCRGEETMSDLSTDLLACLSWHQ
jgi:hypothetical protein